MAWNVGRAATWVADLSDAEISQQVGSRTFARGEAYAAQRRIRSLATRPEGTMILGTIEGSGAQSYQTIIDSTSVGRRTTWFGHCSCPVGFDCKHAVALLITARDVARGIVAEAGPTREGDGLSGAHWSEVFGHLRQSEVLASRPVGRPEPQGDLMPAGLFVDLAYRAASVQWRELPEPAYGLRPTRWTRMGQWHQSLTWHDALPRWASAMRYLPEHERIMARLHEVLRSGSGGAGFVTTAAPLLLGASAEVWPLLAEARDAGIEIMPGEGVSGPVTLVDEPLRPELDVTREDETGDLIVRAIVAGLPGGHDGDRVLVGEPVHGVVVDGPDGLVLRPFDAALGLVPDALEQALLGIRVPAQERSRFLTTAMPGLRDRVRVRSTVPLPLAPATAPPQRVTAHVRVRADVPGEVRLDLGAAYDGRRRAFSTERLSGAGQRDRIAERAALQAATSVHAVPGAVGRGADGELFLNPSVVLTGVAAATFASVLLPPLEADEHVTLLVEGELAAYDEAVDPPVIHLRTDDTGDRDWFDLQVSIEVAGEAVPLRDVFAGIALGEEIMLLESGTWFRLDQPELLRLRDLIAEAREMSDPDSDELRLSAHHVDYWDELVQLGVVDRQSARWTATVDALRSPATNKPPVPSGVRAELRPYQLDGYHWLATLWDAGLGGILADDMGLGKTMQVIATLARAHERGELAAGGHGPVLVVAPTSVVGTWLGELERFAPGVPVVALSRTAGKRGTEVSAAIDGAAVVVTTYAILRLDSEAFEQVRWRGVVLDEAQFVKNRQAKTHLAARRLGAPFTLAVTGTPLENSLMDLWSLLSLTAPGLFPRPDLFTKVYRKPIESGERPELLDRLRRRIRPLMLRRTKEQVALDLPPKQVQLVPVELAPVHRHLYDRQLARERQRVLGLLADPDANRVAILAALTRLRQLALDPALVEPQHEGRAVAAKLQLLVERLRELDQEGHRALVFSQFTGFLRRAEAALGAAGLRTCYLDGSTPDRQQVIRSFRDGRSAAFLISLKAGGFGLTLTEADYVFVLDPWWNPAAEAQAIDRAHRIGQDKPVTVYRLVSTDTIEEKVVALQERKRDLFQRVIDEGGALSGAITADDVKALLELP
ncbi:MAG: DEAD/DEAH box helicase [Intrasporangium sp.]|uniref:DEAD/DEAH box helicase n=1 Tax=Intrasporangium sp. TaxID=1925024 RepID=UPI002649B243|nr:DEAD/DEAH box helicase [Intrasporangium sp.]MDN5795718.1 DEAD/DEAH box helicase [Intrasporangium sp.]